MLLKDCKGPVELFYCVWRLDLFFSCGTCQVSPKSNYIYILEYVFVFSKALGSWLYQIGAFAMVLITWALIPVRPAALHKILCLCQVRTLNGAVNGIQVPLHLTWALIPVKPAAWCFTLHKTLC
jgi:hypothetical protein